MTKSKKSQPNSTGPQTHQPHLSSRVAELEDRLKRSLADYANLEKRIESQRQFFVTLATTAMVTKMIEVLDDFNLTYQHLQDAGLKIAIDKFMSVLKTEGVEEIDALNRKFDPETMECIEAVCGQDNLVISVKKPGYKLNGHVIRPAQVAVGKADITN
ncbi:MAG TPA: nucleotide exchange factor GrpE [Candidatus Woesebacteria bacterium]|nr:nucleotide exchange factor GrpE [Candidatus Woesebacteria bacterium]HOG37622.1 nucleotide exchange factor GrpE [Candidatus Woesebacteria bacterium]